MVKFHHTLRLLLIAVVFFGMSRAGWSITVGPLAGDSVQTDLGYNDTGASYVLPMTEVSWSAEGAYWLKNLLGQNRPTLTEGVAGQNTLTMIENLQVGGNTPWTDWHEVFATDGLSWTQATIVFAGTTTVLPGLTVQISTGGGEDMHNDNIDFFFDALPVGTQITVVKTMIWQGLDVSLGTEQLGTDTIVIREYPTVSTVIPEPATLALLSIGGGMFGFFRRRRLI